MVWGFYSPQKHASVIPIATLGLYQSYIWDGKINVHISLLIFYYNQEYRILQRGCREKLIPVLINALILYSPHESQSYPSNIQFYPAKVYWPKCICQINSKFILEPFTLISQKCCWCNVIHFWPDGKSFEIDFDSSNIIDVLLG